MLQRTSTADLRRLADMTERGGSSVGNLADVSSLTGVPSLLLSAQRYLRTVTLLVSMLVLWELTVLVGASVIVRCCLPAALALFGKQETCSQLGHVSDVADCIEWVLLDLHFVGQTSHGAFDAR